MISLPRAGCSCGIVDYQPVDSSRLSRRCLGALLLAVAFAMVGEVAIAQTKAPPAKPTEISFHVEHR